MVKFCCLSRSSQVLMSLNFEGQSFNKTSVEKTIFWTIFATFGVSKGKFCHLIFKKNFVNKIRDVKGKLNKMCGKQRAHAQMFSSANIDLVRLTNGPFKLW